MFILIMRHYLFPRIGGNTILNGEGECISCQDILEDVLKWGHSLSSLQ